MKKKFLVLLAMAILLPSMIFASDILQMGVNIGYAPTLKTLMDNPESSVGDYFKMDYFSFAPELKINLFCVDLDVLASISFPDDARFQIDTDMAADLYVKLFGVMKLSAGAGLKMPFKMVDDTWYMGTAEIGKDSAKDVFLNSQLSYRAGVGFDCGKFNLMINYAVPTTGTFVNPDFAPNWDEGRFSLGCLFDLF